MTNTVNSTADLMQAGTRRNGKRLISRATAEGLLGQAQPAGKAGGSAAWRLLRAIAQALRATS